VRALSESEISVFEAQCSEHLSAYRTQVQGLYCRAMAEERARQLEASLVLLLHEVHEANAPLRLKHQRREAGARRRRRLLVALLALALVPLAPAAVARRGEAAHALNQFWLRMQQLPVQPAVLVGERRVVKEVQQPEQPRQASAAASASRTSQPPASKDRLPAAVEEAEEHLSKRATPSGHASEADAPPATRKDAARGQSAATAPGTAPSPTDGERTPPAPEEVAAPEPLHTPAADRPDTKQAPVAAEKLLSAADKPDTEQAPVAAEKPLPAAKPSSTPEDHVPEAPLAPATAETEEGTRAIGEVSAPEPLHKPAADRPDTEQAPVAEEQLLATKEEHVPETPRTPATAATEEATPVAGEAVAPEPRPRRRAPAAESSPWRPWTFRPQWLNGRSLGSLTSGPVPWVLAVLGLAAGAQVAVSAARG